MTVKCETLFNEMAEEPKKLRKPFYFPVFFSMFVPLKL